MNIIELAVLLLVVTFIAVGVYLISLLRKLSGIADETQQTLKVLTSDVTITLYQTNELLAKTNVLVEDVNGKVAKLDPLFVAVADLSESVSDLNTSAREIATKAKSTGGVTTKVGSLISGFQLIQSILSKKGGKHG